jgi:predicted SAM-dependent methyltransferase
MRKRARRGLHLGAAGTKLEGLVNCDLFDPAADRKVDATDLTEFADSSVDLIEHHHMIEHLSLEQVDRALREWARVLVPGGILVMTCPDLLRVCLVYLKHRAINLIRPRDYELEYVIRMLVGSQEHEGMFHKSHYDARRMRKLLPEHGFCVEFTYPYPRRMTPSLLVIARRHTSGQVK